MLKFRIEEAVNGFILHINKGDEYLGRYVYKSINEVFKHIEGKLVGEAIENG